MKIASLLIMFFFMITSSYAQFEKNEKLLGGSLDILRIKEKNAGIASGGPFGSTPSEVTDIQLNPEFSYIISKNTGISIFGGLLSQRNADIGGTGAESKYKGYTIGVGLTKYKFYTKDFGLLAKLQASYSPSWTRFYDNSGAIYPKNIYKLTTISLQPGLFYRFSKHFTLTALIAKTSYEHLVSKQEDIDTKRIHNRFSIGFSNISFGAFYIFK